MGATSGSRISNSRWAKLRDGLKDKTENRVSECRADRQSWAIRFLVPIPAGVVLIVYALDDTFAAIIDEGVLLLVVGDVQGLRAWGMSLGLWAPLATWLLMVIQALAAPIPAILVTWVNSLLLGPFVGAIWSIVSATSAATICFMIARAYGEPLGSRLVSDRILAKTEAFMETHGSTAVLAARLLPIVPFDPISYVAGLTRMRTWTFVWATALGQIPAGFTYSYLGQEIDNPVRMLMLGLTGFAALLLIG